MQKVVNGVLDEVHTQALRRATLKKRDTTIPRARTRAYREQRRPPRGTAEEAQEAEAEARQRLNTYSPTGAIGVLIGDDGEEGHS